MLTSKAQTRIHRDASTAIHVFGNSNNNCLFIVVLALMMTSRRVLIALRWPQSSNSSIFILY